VLTEAQLAGLERKREDQEAHGSSRASIPATVARRMCTTWATSKGVGRIFRQTFIDTYSKVAFAKFYDRKTPITSADLLKDRVVRFTVSLPIRALPGRCNSCVRRSGTKIGTNS
jgi:hypothetical protein